MVELQWGGSSYRLSTSWVCDAIQANTAYYCQAWIEVEPRQPEMNGHLAIGRFDLVGYVSEDSYDDAGFREGSGGDYSVPVWSDSVVYAITHHEDIELDPFSV